MLSFIHSPLIQTHVKTISRLCKKNSEEFHLRTIRLKQVNLLQTRWLRDWRLRVPGTSVYMPVYVTSVQEILKIYSEIGLTTQRATILL